MLTYSADYIFIDLSIYDIVYDKIGTIFIVNE